jgi:serine/threonine-protein kinase
MGKQPTARAGKKLGRYRIERELGRGGMGVVYLAEDENTGRQIALKTTSVAGLGGGQTSRNQRRQRFVREVQALGKVNHDNVVHVIEAGEADDPDLGWLLFYSMEYVEGETLAQLVQRKGALDPGAAAAVCMQVSAGLGAAHAAQIVHRDVKPANIFISLDGRALIGDFGICKIEGQTQITRRDQLVGTPNYLAPEQILGDPVSPSTDVFALGALFYVITMNRPLRSHVDAAALLNSAQSNEPNQRMLNERSVPEGLRKVVARCLERDPKKRWRDGSHLADALSEFATRIPPLREETMQDKVEVTSTQDRSSPFQSVPSAPSGDVLEMPQFADPNDVEAAARALLGEVEQRFGPGEPAKVEEKALPVARTESTVMFNLRAMEEEEKKKELPVARTESTAMFKMRDDDVERVDVVRDESTAKLPASRLEATQLGIGDDPTPLGGETSEDGRIQPRVRAFDVDRAQSRLRQMKLPNIKLPDLPRPAWVGISGGAGALIGILLVLIIAPASHSTEKPAATDEVPIEPLTAHQRPPLCPEANDKRVIGKEDASAAKSALKDAIDLATRGAQLKDRESKLGDALKHNPLEPDIYFELAKVYAQQGNSALRDQAYECTCDMSPTSTACKNAKKFLK